LPYAVSLNRVVFLPEIIPFFTQSHPPKGSLVGIFPDMAVLSFISEQDKKSKDFVGVERRNLLP
jgi:hypothetical protein